MSDAMDTEMHGPRIPSRSDDLSASQSHTNADDTMSEISTISKISTPPPSPVPRIRREKPASRRSRERVTRLTRSKKLRATRDLWKDMRWSIGDFLIAWASEPSEPNDGLSLSRRVGLLAKALEQDTVQEALKKHKERVSSGFELDLSSEALLDEIDQLIGKPYFGDYDPELSFEKLSNGYDSIEEHAPTWAGLLKKLLTNRRTGWDSYRGLTDLEPLKKKAYLISSIVCRARARKTSSFFAKAFGIYLTRSGMKRRVLDICESLGLCEGYKSIHKILTQKAGNAQEGSLYPVSYFISSLANNLPTAPTEDSSSQSADGNLDGALSL
jgi:hypothetical protein